MPNTPGVADHGVAPTSFVQRARKALVAAAGLLALVVTTGVLEENQEIYVNAVLAVLTAFGVYQVPNAPNRGPAL